MKHTLCLFMALWLCVGCGGGTSGSGVKSFHGTVAGSDGLQLPGVLVTIESTGDNAVTDEAGDFQIDSETANAEVPFSVEGRNFRNRFVLQNVPRDNARIALNLTVDANSNEIAVRDVTLKAKFIGLCDYYFENREVIRQANRVPSGTSCSLNVAVRAAGKRAANFPVALQYRECSEEGEWVTLLIDRTGTLQDKGTVNLYFTFVDSAEFCQYRVVAGTDADLFASYPIDTFTAQEWRDLKKRSLRAD